MIKLNECPICKSLNWHSLDHLRDFNYWYKKDYREEGEQVGMKVCKICGFTTYDYVEEQRLADFYSFERRQVLHNHIVTCNRKNNYHKKFFDDIFDFRTYFPDYENINILDVGCAQGSFLNFMKEEYGCKNLFGTEYNRGFASFARGEYNLSVTQDMNTNIKYDMISYYHVLEHIQDLDREMRKIDGCLKEEGVLFISIPIFFDVLDESSGMICDNFEELYHLNHVNLFTEKSFLNLLNKHKFKIIAKDEKIYGYTVACIREPSLKFEIQKENYKEIEEIIKRQKIAIEYLNQKNFEKAIEIDPTFIDAYIHFSVNKDNMKDFESAMDVLNKCQTAVPEWALGKLLLQKAKLYFQWDEHIGGEEVRYSNNIKQAEKLFYKIMEEYKPESEEGLYFLAIIEGKYKKNYGKAIDYLKRCYKVNPSKFAEIFNLLGLFYKEKEKHELAI